HRLELSDHAGGGRGAAARRLRGQSRRGAGGVRGAAGAIEPGAELSALPGEPRQRPAFDLAGAARAPSDLGHHRQSDAHLPRYRAGIGAGAMIATAERRLAAAPWLADATTQALL